MKCCILFIYEINNATILFMEVNFYTALFSVVGSLGELNGDIAGIAIGWVPLLGGSLEL